MCPQTGLFAVESTQASLSVGQVEGATNLLQVPGRSASPAEAAPPSSSATTADPPAAEPDAGKQPYPPPAAQPTQPGPQGIRFDFNLGARVVLPNRDRGQVARPAARPRHRQHPVREREPGRLRQLRQALLRPLRHRGLGLDDAGVATPVLTHEYDARDRDVLIQFPVGTLGDILAWFPYAARFAEAHGCRLTCAMSGLIIPLLRDAYPAHPLRHA